MIEADVISFEIQFQIVFVSLLWILFLDSFEVNTVECGRIISYKNNSVVIMGL